MRPVIPVCCAALLLVASVRARAAEPKSSGSQKNETADTEESQNESATAEKTKTDRAKAEREPPTYPPPGARWGIIGVGLAATAISYGAAAGMSYAFPDAPGARDLRTPIIGPWQAIAHNGCAPGDTECSQVWIVMRSIATAIGGLAQAGGILVAIEGVFMPTQYAPEAPVRSAPKAPSEPAPGQEPPKTNDKNLFWIPTPMAMGAGGVGLGVVGRF